MVAGRFAHAWRGPNAAAERLPFELVLATALHDFGWRTADDVPLFDPGTGRPRDFVSYPLERKLQLYARAIDELETVHPYVALLVSLHYSHFAGLEGIAPLQADEARRRERLTRALGLGAGDHGTVELHLRYLQLFDNLSLYLCLAPPSADAAASPPWVNPSMFANPPEGGLLAARWGGDDRLVLDPFPFDAPLRLRIACRDLDALRYPSARALDVAWGRAVISRWSLTIEPE